MALPSMNDNEQQNNAMARLGPPDTVTLAIRKIPEGQRTPAQRKQLQDRVKLEQKVASSGGEVVGGIAQLELDAQKAKQEGVRTATGAMNYDQSYTSTLKAGGYAPNGTRTSANVPGQPAGTPLSMSPQSAPTTAGSMRNKSPAGLPPDANTGFAMRTDANGMVQTSSGAGTPNAIQGSFTTKDAALNFYGRPTSAPVPPAPATQAAPPPYAPAPGGIAAGVGQGPASVQQPFGTGVNAATPAPQPPQAASQAAPLPPAGGIMGNFQRTAGLTPVSAALGSGQPPLKPETPQLAQTPASIPGMAPGAQAPSMAMSSQFTSPTAKTKMFNRNLGTPRADAGTQAAMREFDDL